MIARSTFSILLVSTLRLAALASGDPTADSVSAPRDLGYHPGQTLLKAQFFEERYLHYSLEHILSNYYEFATYQLETTGEFSSPDRFTFSFNGNSHKWNRYRVDNHRIDDAFFPGASLHKILLFDRDLQIDYSESEIRFQSSQLANDRVFANWNNGELGGRIPFADQYIHLMHNHNSSFEDAYQPIGWRKKTSGSGLIYFSKDFGRFKQSGHVNLGRRYHTGFGPGGIDNYYPEEYQQLFLDGRYTLPKEGKEIGYLFTYSGRDNLYAEFNHHQRETSSCLQLNGSAFLQGENSSSGVNVGYKYIDPAQAGFSRNVIDQDGEGLEPWYPGSRFWQFTFNHNQHGKTGLSGLGYQFELHNTFTHQNPLVSRVTNPIYYDKPGTTWRALEVIEWESSAFAGGLLENAAGLVYSAGLGKSGGIRLELDGTFDGFVVKGKSFSQLNYRFDLSSYLMAGRSLRFGFNLGRRPVPFHYDYIRYFSEDYLSGRSYFWEDSNNDRVYQTEEKNGLKSSTGGEYHHLSGQLLQPVTCYFDLDIAWRPHGRWRLNWTGQFRSYRNLWTTRYDRPESELGYYHDLGGGRELFFLNGGQDLQFQTVPLEMKAYFPGGDSSAKVWNNPYYVASVLGVEKEGRFFLKASLTAQMAVGVAAFGNGVLHNGLDVLSETSANPNTRIKGIGRLDSDRAYVVRWLVGYQIIPGLNMSFQMMYRDGQPTSLQIATLSTVAGNTQAGLWNIAPKGISPVDGEFGYREPGFWNYEIRFRYTPHALHERLSLDLFVYNLLDVATTLSYYNHAPGVAHSVNTLDVQIPRGFILGLNLRI